MKKYENQCVECGKDVGCIGKYCPYVNVQINYCDQCQYENAEYQIDGYDYCESCANKYLQEYFNDLTIAEKADVLDIKLNNIDDI